MADCYEYVRTYGNNIVDASRSSSYRDLDAYFRSPEDAPPRYLLMLRGYIDESGHEGRDWVSVAGFIGTEDQWATFLPKWREALGQKPFLHMNGLRWKKDSTKRLLARLGPIPCACGLIGARGVVRVADYEDLVVGSPDQTIFKGYVACLLPMVTQILKGIPPHERIELVFEYQREYWPLIEMAMHHFTFNDGTRQYRFTPDGKPKLAKWSSVPKGSTLMTDPADYLAFALREHHANPTSKKAAWSQPIFCSPNGYGLTLSRDRVRRIILGAQRMFNDDVFGS